VPLLKAADPPPGSPPPAPADAERLNEKYQAQLTALAKEGGTRFHFVDYAPPAFMVFRDQIALQMTLPNSIQFGLVKGSIYKRAAQSLTYSSPLNSRIYQIGFHRTSNSSFLTFPS
jgi:hypothetical protein